MVGLIPVRKRSQSIIKHMNIMIIPNILFCKTMILYWCKCTWSWTRRTEDLLHESFRIFQDLISLFQCLCRVHTKSLYLNMFLSTKHFTCIWKKVNTLAPFTAVPVLSTRSRSIINVIKMNFKKLSSIHIIVLYIC